MVGKYGKVFIASMYVKLGLPVEYSLFLHVWFPPIRFHLLRLPLIQDAARKFAHSGSVQTEKNRYP